MPRRTRARARALRRRERRGRESALAYLMLLPSLLLFAIFVYYPFAKNFQLPFYRPSVTEFGAFGGTKQYVGWTQWREILTSDEFRHSLLVTVKFVVLTVPAGIVLGLLLATLAHQRLRGVTIYRTIFSSTVATSAAVASTIFFSLFGPTTGLWKIHVGGHSILEDRTWALPAIAAVAVWQSLGLSFIVMSAGLQAIPDDLVEAARIDGAGRARVFRLVTLPLLSPTIFFAFVVGSISAFKTFAEVDLLTPNNGLGGPAGSTNLLSYKIKTLAFDGGGHPNQAAVFAVGMFVMVLLLTLLQFRLERRVHYAR